MLRPRGSGLSIPKDTPQNTAGKSILRYFGIMTIRPRRITLPDDDPAGFNRFAVFREGKEVDARGEVSGGYGD